jgi:hypothetical protein
MDEPIRECDVRSGILANRRRFILLFGVLGWGVPSAFLFSLLFVLRKGFPPGWYLTSGFLSGLALALILFGIGGVFLGATLWERFAKRFRAHAVENRNGAGS